MSELNVIEIVRNYLTAHGYNGLYCTIEPCGCSRDDLAPCGQLTRHCRPAYRQHCERCGHDVYGPRWATCGYCGGRLSGMCAV